MNVGGGALGIVGIVQRKQFDLAAVNSAGLIHLFKVGECAVAGIDAEILIAAG